MYIPDADAAKVLDAVDSLSPSPGDGVLLFFGEERPPDPDDVIAGLVARDLPFFGGIFPGVISGAARCPTGAIVKVLPLAAPPVVVEGLGTDLTDGLAKIDEIDTSGGLTAVILVDGLTSDIDRFLREMFNRMGDAVHYFGGGAGSLSLERKPCILTRDGLVEDAAVVGFVPLETHLGVRHGWRKIMGPIVATRTRKNVIVELNWRNAFEVYSEAIEQDTGKILTRENFFELTNGHPFGMYREGSEDVVRDPIQVTDSGELVCVGEVPENTVLNILTGDADSLIDAAGQAADDCFVGSNPGIRDFLVADCISRVIFLEDGFERELATVQSRIDRRVPGVVLEGVLTLGEISSYGEGSIEFFNKTIVTSAFHG